jgi:hypothetical protein
MSTFAPNSHSRCYSIHRTNKNISSFLMFSMLLHCLHLGEAVKISEAAEECVCHGFGPGVSGK